MYEVNAGFDQINNNLYEEIGMLVQADQDGFSQIHLSNRNTNPNFSTQEQSLYPQENQQELAISAMEIELQNQLNMEMEQCYNNNNNNEIQQIMQEMSNFNGDYVQNGHFASDTLNNFPYPKYLPSLQNSFFNSAPQKSSSFLASLGLLGDLNNPTVDSGLSVSANVVYDPLLPLNLPPRPPLLKDLFHFSPHEGYKTLGGSRSNGSLFSGVDERHIESVGALYDNSENGFFEFTAGEMDCLGKMRAGKATKHYTTEKHRRVLSNEKYVSLKKLVANLTKGDRASIVGGAIEYINELKRSVSELKLLVEKKRCVRERLKRLKTEDYEGNQSNGLVNMDHPCNGSTLRSSWIHRKFKNTEVDVRIIDDEVNVKVVQQKRINCLLFVSKVLDELQLDIYHVAGGLIGDYYSFFFNSKICEGSIVYASAIANKLIEVVDKHYAATN